jgi:hypothetical protein
MEQDAEVLDLMSALQRSLKEKPQRGTRAAPKASRTASQHRGARHGPAKAKPKAAEPTHSRRRAANT